MKNLPGPKYELRDLRPSQIRIDPLYQRPLDAKRVNEIVKNFNSVDFRNPNVSYRSGVYWVFDGQHTTAAWRALNNNEDEPIECRVFRGMTWLDECDAFVRQNKLKKDPTTNDKLRAGFNSKDPDVVDMVEKAKLCGFVVDFAMSKTPTRIVATNTLFRAYKMIGGEAYFDMMQVIKEAWYGDMDAISSQVLSGMATTYQKFYGNFRHEDMVSSMKRISPAAIIRDGRSTKGRTNTYAHEIVKGYNKGRRYRLDETVL